ncbi:MAG: hypothetical protein HZB35_00705 [Nitrospirae bacterium]|nr:hypothetical protein [Nitrospirota bacterium]
MCAVLALVALMLLTWAAAIAATFDEEEEDGQPHQPEEDPATARDQGGRPDEDR